MKQITSIFLVVVFAGLCALAQYPYPTINNDGTLRQPTNFFATNTVLLKGALAYDISINSGVPNGTGADIHWSRLFGVPAGFADNTDDGGGGGGYISAVSSDFQVSGSVLSITNTTGTGQILRASSLTLYATLDSPQFTGTVGFEFLQADTVQVPWASRYATANGSSNLVGTLDGGSWTNLNGTEIRSGTVAAARLDPTMATEAEVAATYAPLASPALTGDPTVPTATAGDNDTSAASTAFIAQRIPSIAYDATTWNGNTNAPTMDAVRDKFESLSTGGTTISTNNAVTGSLVAYQPDGSLATTNIAIASTNTAFGVSAGRGLTSGNFNTFIGYNAATNTTTGNSSVIIGYQAGKDATNSIGFTTIVGTAAGPSVMADFNTLLGYHTGNLLRNGGNNVFVGYHAGNNTTNGLDNVFIGSQSGSGSGSGSRNTFVGRQAGNANTSANDNVYIGYQSGLLSTTSDGNTFVGVESGETLTTGANNNTFVGYRSGRLITSGYNNTFLGYGSGNTHTIGNNNIFLGINVNGNTNTANHFLAGGSGQPITSVYFGEGIADASPSSFSLRATSGTGTDIAGAGITIAGGQSTGSGAGGSITFQTSPAGSTGTSTNALVTALLIGSDGKISVTKTITAAGTTSVQTINKVAGSVNLAAAATSVVVTNSLVNVNSVVIGTVASNDTTAKSVAIVPESGKFTIYPNAATTAETRVNWIVIN